MKTLLTIAIIVFLTSCSKNAINELSESDQILFNQFKILPDGLEELLRSIKSTPESSFDQAIFNHFLSLDSLLRDSTFYIYLIDNGLFSDTNIIAYSEVLKSYNSFIDEIVFNENFLTQIDNDSNLFVDGKQYFPCLNISNFDHLNPENYPIVAFGLDLESIDDSISDVIYGRYYQSFQNQIEIEVNEINGTTSEIPVLILTVGLIEEIVFEPTIQSNSLSSEAELTHILKEFWYPTVDEYSIVHLFDRSKRAEYKEIHTLYYSNMPSVPANSELIKRIHKDDLGKTFYDD